MFVRASMSKFIHKQIFDLICSLFEYFFLICWFLLFKSTQCVILINQTGKCIYLISFIGTTLINFVSSISFSLIFCNIWPKTSIIQCHYMDNSWIRGWINILRRVVTILKFNRLLWILGMLKIIFFTRLINFLCNFIVFWLLVLNNLWSK